MTYRSIAPRDVNNWYNPTEAAYYRKRDPTTAWLDTFFHGETLATEPRCVIFIGDISTLDVTAADVTISKVDQESQRSAAELGTVSGRGNCGLSTRQHTVYLAAL